MAAPRVFVSSTYYDLQHIRNDIRIFLQNLGYEPVMHDKGNIPYTQDVSLEDSCYNELSTCDIVVCIIGNKFGSKSAIGDYSITMTELKTAIKNRKKIFIYILKDVFAENLTYSANKANNFIPAHVDNIKIHEFISELKDTVKNHPIIPFETVSDITNNLRDQFAGIFQWLLSQSAMLTESKTYEDLKETADIIRELISNISTENDSFYNKLSGTIYAVRPSIRKILAIFGGKKYDLFIPNKDALIQYLSDLGFSVSEDELFDDLICTKYADDFKYTLKLDSRLFDGNDNIADIRDKNLLAEYITYTSEIDDGLPF